MRSLVWIGLVVVAAACEEVVSLERALSSFEVQILDPVGTPERRCILPGTPTVAVDLSGCPTYERDASGSTVLRLRPRDDRPGGFTARAIDEKGELLETFNGLATVKVVPGSVESAFQRIEFKDGVTDGPQDVSFRSAFGDTFLWVLDDVPPRLGADLPLGMNAQCGFDTENVCAPFNLACVNTKPVVGDDARGLAYCTTGCATTDECPEGYFCAEDAQVYDDSGTDTSSGVCVRKKPTFSTGVAGPIHLVEPTLADVSRSESMISSPFEENFIEIRHGKLVVTAVRIDGFYVTDVCPELGKAGAPPDADCSAEDLARAPEFNHLFVFTFGRPTTNPRGDESEDLGSRELLAGDRIRNLSGPMSEFNGLTEMNFPEWEVIFEESPYPTPAAADLHNKVALVFPSLMDRGQACFEANVDPNIPVLLDCDFAMERLEGARVSARVEKTNPVPPGSSEADNLERYGQWPVTINTGRKQRTFQLITRENIPFFNPRKISDRAIGQTVTGNLRQVAFDDRSEPIWIIEPRDQSDCTWCVSP